LTAQQSNWKAGRLVTTVLFDDRYELLHDRIDLKGVNPITEQDYFVRGSTALLDAIGRTIAKIESAQEHTSKEQRPDKTLFTIITDGYENASREYSYHRIKQLIEQQKETGWEFVFIGANMDAVAAADRMGIRRDRAANYMADGAGVSCCYEAVSNLNRDYRCRGSIKEDWNSKMEADVRKRGRRR
jgi:hypothetical protein